MLSYSMKEESKHSYHQVNEKPIPISANQVLQLRVWCFEITIFCAQKGLGNSILSPPPHAVHKLVL